MKQIGIAMIALSLAFGFGANAADDKKDTRAGNCADAKSQMEYFCDDKNAASDSMVAIGTACTNAKNNVKAACEGVVAEDKAYK